MQVCLDNIEKQFKPYNRERFVIWIIIYKQIPTPTPPPPQEKHI